MSDEHVALSPRQAWAYPRFRRYVYAFSADNLADTTWLVTLGWLASRSGNPATTGLVWVASAVPTLLFTLGGGALVDRYSSAQAAFFTSLARCAALVGWAVVVGADARSMFALAAIAFVVGAIEGIHLPALDAYPRSLLPVAGQTTGAGILRIPWRAAQIVGPLVAGYFLDCSSALSVALIGLGLVAATTVLLAGLRSGTAAESVHEPSEDSSIRAGLRYVRGHRALPFTITAQAAVNTSSGALTLVALPLKAHALSWSAVSYGSMFAAFGLGLMAATWAVLQWQHRVSETRRVAVGMACAVIASVVVCAIAPVTTVALGVLLSFFLGLSLGPVGTLLTGYSLVATEKAFTGRVQALIGLVTTGVEPVGFLVVGLLAAVGSAALATFVVGATSTLLAVLAAVLLIYRCRRGLPIPVDQDHTDIVGDISVEKPARSHAQDA